MAEQGFELESPQFTSTCLVLIVKLHRVHGLRDSQLWEGDGILRRKTMGRSCLFIHSVRSEGNILVTFSKLYSFFPLPLALRIEDYEHNTCSFTGKISQVT